MEEKRFSRRQFFRRGLALTGVSAALQAVGTASGATPTSIAAENRLTGTAQSTWDLNGVRQYSAFGLTNTITGIQPVVAHFIEGFADNMSVNHGQTINFKVNTDATNYRIDIYRLGYYEVSAHV